MEECLLRLEARLDSIEQRLVRIEEGVRSAGESCDNMDDHIHFVEGVMAPFLRPFSFANRFVPSRLLAKARYRAIDKTT